MTSGSFAETECTSGRGRDMGWERYEGKEVLLGPEEDEEEEGEKGEVSWLAVVLGDRSV